MLMLKETEEMRARGLVSCKILGTRVVEDIAKELEDKQDATAGRLTKGSKTCQTA